MGTVFDQQFEHLLRRAGFGARPDELATFRTLSFNGAVDRLVNYEQVVRDREAINAWGPDVVVLDEAQRIKNWEAKTSRELQDERR